HARCSMPPTAAWSPAPCPRRHDVSDTGKQSFGLGRPLRDLLPVEGDRASTPRALFGVPEARDETSTDALDAALSFAAAALPDDLWGFTAWRPEGGLVTRIAGAAEPAEAWALADALRAAVVDQ